MSDTELIEVVDVTITFPVAGRDGLPVTMHYTVRPGDSMVQQAGTLVIKFAAKDVRVGTELRSLPGDDVTFVIANLAAIERKTRLEPKTRPSAAMLRNREKAELDELKSKLLES